MFNFLLDLVSDDGNPDFVINNYSFDLASFIIGIIAGLAISLIIWCVFYVIKMYINNEVDNDDNSKKDEK